MAMSNEESKFKKNAETQFKRNAFGGIGCFDLIEYERKGSLTAKHLLYSTISSRKAQKLLKNYKLEANDDEKEAEILEFIVGSLRHGICTLCQEEEEKEQVTAFVAKMMDKVNKINEISELDKKTRIAQNLYLNSSIEGISFNEDCLEKYPDETLFYQMRMNFFLLTDDLTKGAKFSLEASNKFPDDYEILCLVANMYFNKLDVKLVKKNLNEFAVKLDELKEMYKKYLDKAPKDHQSYPEAYYNMALLHRVICEELLMAEAEHTSGTAVMIRQSSEANKHLQKCKKYHDKGIEAEKEQLSCFLPYDLNIKHIVGEFLNHKIIQKLLNSFKPLKTQDADIITFAGGSRTEIKFSPNGKIFQMNHVRPIEDQLTKSHRVSIIKQHRQSIKNSNNEFHHHGQIEMKNEPGSEPIHNLAKMKARLLKNTNFKKEKIYKNSFIELTIVEDPLFLDNNSVAIIAQDDEWDAQQIVINNFEKDLDEFLGFGCKITIVKPHFTFDQNKSSIIQVDDPNNLVFSGERELTRCRFCGNSIGTLSCSKCGRKYCSKECQTKDWKILKHKLICK